MAYVTLWAVSAGPPGTARLRDQANITYSDETGHRRHKQALCESGQPAHACATDAVGERRIDLDRQRGVQGVRPGDQRVVKQIERRSRRIAALRPLVFDSR